MPEQSNQGNSSSVSYSAANSITSATSQSGQTYTSTTADENALLISTSANVTITNPTVTKSGDSDGGDNCNFYGINSAVMAMGGGTVSITGGTVTATAKGANGVFSYGGNGGTNGAAGDGTTVYISGTTINTSGDNGGGIMTTGGGNTVAKNLTITTTGNSSAPIRTDRGGGSVTVSGGSYTSSGLGSPAIYSTADITVENATLTSNKSEGVCIEGQNSVALTNCTLNASNTQTNGNAQFLDAVILYQSQSGDAASGTATFTMTNGTINNTSGHVFHVTNTSAVISLTNVTINDSGAGVLLSVCDDGWSGASNIATLNASGQELDGDILVGDDSTLTLNLTNGTTFTGKVSGSITNNAGTTVSSDVGTVNVSLDSTSKWYLEEDTYITSFSGTAANVITSGYTLYVNNVALDGTTETDEADTSTGVTISNSTSNSLITGTAYADSITNSGDGVTINALASGDTIINTGASVSISGGAGEDSIRNYGTKGTISAGDGDDYIDNTFLADSVAIDAGAGDDMIYAASSYLTINAGTGDDSIYVQATSSGTTQGGLRNSILGGAGADTIENEGKQTTIDGGAGSDYIDNTELAGNNVIRGGAGADFIYNSAASVTIDAGEDNDYIDNFEGNVTISAGAGADTVYNSYGSSVSISGGDGNDSIHNAPHSDNATITAGAGADTIINRSDSALIDGGAGNDRIQNGDSDDYSPYGVNSTISGGAGSDTISNIRASVSIGGGADNDSIRNMASNVTITGGAGADTVYNVGSNVLIQYTSGDGNDTINDLSTTSTLSIAGAAYTSVQSGDDLIIGVGTGSITLVDAASLSTVNIIGTLASGSDTTDSGSGQGTSDSDTSSSATQRSVQYEFTTGTVVYEDADDRHYLEPDNNHNDQLNVIGYYIAYDTSTGNTVPGENIYMYGRNRILRGDGNDTITNQASNVLIYGTSGNDTIRNYAYYGDGSTIYAQGGNDDIYNEAPSVLAYGEGGDDSIVSFSAKNSSIDGGAGNDDLYGTGNSVSISGGTGDDSIALAGENITVDAGAGNDLILSSNSNNVTISGGAGADTISLYSSATGNVIQYNSGDGNDSITGFNATSTISIDGAAYTSIQSGSDIVLGVGTGSITLEGAASLSTVNIIGTLSGGGSTDSGTLQGTSGNDSLEIVHEEISWAGGIRQTIYSAIYGLAGDDTLENVNEIYTYDGYTDYKNNVIMDGGTGNDLINNYGANSKLTGGDGNDYIVNHGDNVTISGGAGNDTIDNDGDNVSINAGDGDNSIDNSGTNVTLDALGNGNDSVYNTGNGLTINTGAGNNHVYNSGATLSITAGDGNDDIINDGSNVTINAGAGNNLIIAGGSNAIINTGAGNDSIRNNSNNSSISTGDGSDTIRNYGYNSSIITGAGNDSIHDSSDNSSISTGAGNDSIDVIGDNVTISGGAGNDTIYNIRGEGENILIQYASGDGNDSITGFNATSTISIDGAAYTSIQSGSDIVLGVGTGSITLVDAADLSTVNIIGTLSGGSDTQETAINITNTTSNTVINGSAYNDTITNRASNVTINAQGGNDIITNNYTTSPDNVSISGGAGADTIENAGDNSTVLGGAGNDSISNVMSTGAILDGGEGADTIESYGERASVSGGAGNDSIGNYRNGSTVLGGAGNDTIENTGDTVRIDAGAGNDSVYSHCQDVTISGAGGNDTIVIGGDNHLVQYSSGDGNDLIQGFKANSSISIGGAAYTSVASGSNIILGVGNGSITLEGAASLSTVNIIGTLDGGSTPADSGVTLNNTANNTLITGTAYADSITNSGTRVTIQALAGNDYIANVVDSSVTTASLGNSISAGNGNDTIIMTGADSTITGNLGNDVISLSSADSSNVLINYANGDGNDTVYGFTADDTLSVDSTYKIQVSGNDLIVTVGDGKITLVDAASLSYPNIESSNQLVQVVEAILKRTAAGYPVIAGLVFNPEEITGPEPDNYAAKEAWTITSADNLELYGVHYTPENSNDKWVVLVHGYGLQYESMNPFATFYLANNYNVLMIDQRAAGKSEGTWLTMGVAESQDVALWTQEIARRNSNAKITLHGVSMGAATAMLAAARSDTKNVTSIIEDCGYSDVMTTFGVIVANHPELAALGISSELIPLIDPVAESLTGYYLHDAAPIDSISSVKLPSLFISGDDDGVAPVSMLSELYDASGAEVKEKFIVKGAGHAQAGLNDPVGYSNTVFRFVAEADGEGWSTENIFDNISLRGTKYNDTLANSGDGVTITAGAGNDTIENTGDSVSIDAGAGNDSVYSHCEDVTQSGAGGNDTIVIGGDNHLVNYASGDGNDYITGFKANSSISIGGAAYTSVQSGNDIILTIGDGKVTLTDAASLETLNIIGTLDGGGTGVTIDSTASNTLITGTAYNDSIKFAGRNVTINAGKGDDTLVKGGFFGAGVTALVEYAAGDGNDYIDYLNANDTLSISGSSYDTFKSGYDMVITVGDDSITVANAATADELYIIGDFAGSVEQGNYIINRLSNTVISGTDKPDTITNYGNYVTIDALGAQDSIRNYGNRVSVSGGTGFDYIDNFVSLVTIDAGSGRDTVNNIGGNYVTIMASAGDDTIINGTGGNNVVFVYNVRDDGNDLIRGFNETSTLSIVASSYESGNFTSVKSGSDIVLTFVESKESVTLQGAANLSTLNIVGGVQAGVDIYSTGNNTLITGTDYADTVENTGANVTINVGAGNDTIYNSGDNSAVNAGAGNDTISSGGDNTSIFGGAGHDTILNHGDGATITGGKGDDTIYSSNFDGTTYRYASGDGNDFIQNFDRNDTLVVIDSDFTTSRAYDAVVVVTVGEGQITLLGEGAMDTPNIVKESGGLEIHNTTNNTLITGSDYDDTISNTGTRVTVRGLAGNDYIANVVDSSVTTASLGNSISAGDGNDTIYNYHTYNPTLEGGAGDDSIVVSNGHLTYIDGGAGADTILGVSESIQSDDWSMGGHATIYGGEGDDYINPGYTNDSSIFGDEGNDTLIVNGANTTIDGGTGNNLIQLTTVEGGDTPQYIIFNGKTTVEGFGTGFGDNSDTIYVAGNAPNVDFKSDGLTFYRGDKSVTLSDVTTTAQVNIYYADWDELSRGVYIADDDWHNVTRAELAMDNLHYIGATASKNHGLNFDLIRTPLNVTLDTDYNPGHDFYVNNVYSIRGGAGNTTITGSAKSDTILAGTGSTTINAGAGGDILSGNGKTTFNIDSGATTAVNGSAGDSLNVSDDSLIFMTDGTAYIVNGRLRRVSDNTVLESAEGDIISGDNVKGATIVDGTSASLTSADRELVIGKNGASLKGYTLDKAFIRNEADAATIIDLINATDSSQLVLDSGTFYTKNQKPIVLEDYDTSNGTFVNIKTADGRKTIFGWSPLNGGLVDGNSIDKPQVIFGDAPNGNSIIRGGNRNDSIYAGAKDIVSLSGGHDELHINDETSHGVTVDMGDGSAQSRTRVVDGFDVTRDLLKIDSPENINARILDGSLQFIKGDSRVTFDELATFDDANGLQVQIDGRTYELRNDYDGGLKGVDYFWTDTDGNYYITDSTFRIHDDGSTREYFIAEGSGKLTIDGFNFGRDKDKLNLNSIGGLTAYGDNLYIESSGDSDVVEVTGGAGKTIDIKLDGTTYTAQLGKHLTYDLAAEYYGDLHGGTGCAISIAANFAQEEVAIYLNEEEEADGKTRYYGGVTKIDASAFTGRASLVGSEFNDQIIAARGDTSLWGGEAGDDELFGTGSGNSFFYCMGNGDDKIYNAADGDSVNLVDIRLEDITNSIISDGAVTLELSDGGRLTVMNSADVTFNLGDGTSWKADRQAKEWQQQA